MSPEGKNVFKSPKQLVKRLFVGTKKNQHNTKQENENAKDITFQARKGWFENFKKGTLCPTHSL